MVHLFIRANTYNCLQYINQKVNSSNIFAIVEDLPGASGVTYGRCIILICMVDAGQQHRWQRTKPVPPYHFNPSTWQVRIVMC